MQARVKFINHHYYLEVPEQVATDEIFSVTTHDDGTMVY